MSPEDVVDRADVTASDRRAALVDQRDFLLRSLDDLEAEWAAGDLAEDDYRELKDDYTARAAAVLRALEADAAPGTTRAPRPAGAARRSEPASDGAASSPRRRRTLLVWVGVVAVALVAGFLVKEAAGRRGADDNITGGGTESSRTLLADGDALLDQGDVAGARAAYLDALDLDPENVDALLRLATAQVLGGEVEAAIATYDDALALEPDNVEALAYQGSLFHRQGDTERALEQLDRAAEIDPGYLDTWSLRLVVLADADRFDEGIEDIRSLAARGDDDIALAVAQQVASALEPVQALQVFDAVVEGAPDNAVAITYRAWQPVSLVLQGALTGDDATLVLEEALGHLDDALALDPALPDALAFRTIVLHRLGRDDEAVEALRAFDAVDPPPEMQAIVDQSGLRDELGVTPGDASEP